MAEPQVDISVGWTITFGTSAFSAQIVDVKPPALTREKEDTSHQGTTTARTSIPVDLRDNGDMSMLIHYRPGVEPPINEDPETITMAAPSGTTLAFTGYAVEFDPQEATLNQKMTARLTVAVSGTIDVQPEGSAGGGSFTV